MSTQDLTRKRQRMAAGTAAAIGGPAVLAAIVDPERVALAALAAIIAAIIVVLARWLAVSRKAIAAADAIIRDSAGEGTS